MAKLIHFSNHLFAGIDALARRRFLSILVAFFLSFGGSWLWALSHGIPIPYIQDEFSYLLAGDTFAHGRVTNPPHPMWVYFETFYVLQHPTYMSIYPPGQGIFLATGQVFFGHPIYGVWLSAGLMCAAICWMLYAWVSPRWALIGGVAAVLQFGIFTYWSQSYWGGAVAGIGGALALGALPRIFKAQRMRDAFWLGLGCAVLANSRPLEGFLVAIPVGCLVLPWKIRWKELVLAKFLIKIILPLGIILFITVLGIGAYNKKITGDAHVFPHFLYANTYSSVPVFFFQPLRPLVHFNNANMAAHEQNYPRKDYFDKRTWGGFFKCMYSDCFRMLLFFFGFPLAIPSLVFLSLYFIHRHTAVRFWCGLLVLMGAFAVNTSIARTHYFAPLTCLAVLLITFGLRGLGGLKFRKERVGSVVVIFLIALQLILNIILTPVVPRVTSLARNIQSSPISLPPIFTREQLKDILMKQGGKYLVIVKYPLLRSYRQEWVHNDAGIDYSPIVWARDMGEEQNKKLLEYFKDRQVVYIMIFWEKPEDVFFYKRQ